MNQLQQPFNILHVDDEEDFLGLTKTFFSKIDKKLHISTALHGEEALFFIKSGRKCDLVISDYHMPEMNGLEFFRELRTLDNNVPFILLTGKASEREEERARLIGVDLYLQKKNPVELFSSLYLFILDLEKSKGRV